MEINQGVQQVLQLTHFYVSSMYVLFIALTVTYLMKIPTPQLYMTGITFVLMLHVLHLLTLKSWLCFSDYSNHEWLLSPGSPHPSYSHSSQAIAL